MRLRNNIPQRVDLLAGLKIYAEYQFDIEKIKGEKMPIYFSVMLLSEKKMGCCDHHQKTFIDCKMTASMNNKQPVGDNRRYSIPDEEFKVQKINNVKPVLVGPFGRETLRYE